MVYLHLNIPWQQSFQHSSGIRLVYVVRPLTRRQGHRLHGYKLFDCGPLGHSADETRVGQVDDVHISRNVVFHGYPGNSQSVDQFRGIADPSKVRPDFHSIADQEVTSLPAYGNYRDWLALPQHKTGYHAVQVGVETTAQPTVSTNMNYADSSDFPRIEKRRDAFSASGNGSSKMTNNLSNLLGIGPPRQGTLLCALHLGRGDHLHGPRYLGRTLDALNASPQRSRG